MNLSQFPILSVSLTYNKGKPDARAISLTEKALTTLTKALDDGSVMNVAFKDMKDYLNRAFELAWKNTVSEIYLAREHGINGREGTELERDLYYTCPQCHTAVGLLKKIEKSKENSDMVKAAKSLLNEIGPLAVGVNSLKDKIVKRQVKAPEDVKARFSPEAVRGTALEKIKATLEQVCEGSYNALVAMFVERQNHYLKMFVESGEKSPYDFFISKRGRRGNALAYKIVSSVTSRDRPDQPAKLLPQAEIDRKFAASAKKDADAIRDGFIYKNLAKLASIVDKKGDLDKIEVVGRNVDLGGLSGTLRLTFHSGASFTVTNSVVFVRNNNGTEFNRFPLNFGEVNMSDGTRMKTPSEEKMNTLFD